MTTHPLQFDTLDTLLVQSLTCNPTTVPEPLRAAWSQAAAHAASTPEGAQQMEHRRQHALHAADNATDTTTYLACTTYADALATALAAGTLLHRLATQISAHTRPHP